MDLRSTTLKEMLEKKMGAEKAARVLKKVNDANSNGMSGDELRDFFKKAVEDEGHEFSDIPVLLDQP